MRHFSRLGNEPVRRGKNAASRQLCVAAAVALLSAAPVYRAWAQAGAVVAAPAASASVTVDVREAQLEDAVQLLTKQTNANNVVFVKVHGKEFGTVTMKMEDQPFDKVLRAMATSAQATVSLEDGVYYLRPRGSEEAPPVTPVAAPAPQPVVKKHKGEFVSLSLQYLSPSTFRALVGNAELLQSDPLLKPLEAEMQKSRTAAPYINQPAATAPTGPADTVKPMNDGLSAGRSGDDTAGQRGFGGQGGAGGGFGGAPGGGGAQGGRQGAGGFLPEGIDRVISYDANNTLLVQGEPEGIEELRALIRLLDVAPRQVMVKVEFVQLNLNDSDQFGIDWQFKFANNIDTNIPAQGGSAPTFLLAYAGGNAVANLRASLIRNTGNLVQSPIITTTNNTPASINFSTTQPVFNSTTIITNGISQTSTQVQSVPVNNGLSVVPHINGDNSISMGIAPILSRFSIVNGPNGVTAPSITSQQLTTYRRVQSGETIMLGGFITRQEDRAVQKTPVLGDLPIIGSIFFTQTTRTRTGNEVLVFLTPTIIEDRSTGTTGVVGSAPPTP